MRKTKNLQLLLMKSLRTRKMTLRCKLKTPNQMMIKPNQKKLTKRLKRVIKKKIKKWRMRLKSHNWKLSLIFKRNKMRSIKTLRIRKLLILITVKTNLKVISKRKIKLNLRKSLKRKKHPKSYRMKLKKKRRSDKKEWN